MGFFSLWIASVLNRSLLRVRDWREKLEADSFRSRRRSFSLHGGFHAGQREGIYLDLVGGKQFFKRLLWTCRSLKGFQLHLQKLDSLSWRSVVGRTPGKKHDIQMMFNISIDGGSFSKNLEDFDSIRSVLLYRSVKSLHYPCIFLLFT